MKRIYFLMIVAIFAIALAGVSSVSAQGGIFNKAKEKIKEKTKTTGDKNKPPTKTENVGDSEETSQTGSGDDDTDARSENAKKLAKAAGMPKAANASVALNKLLFQAADDHRLIPRRVVVTDKDYLMTQDARGTKVRRIFAVLARTLDDGSGKCGKQMAQFDQDFREGKWGAVYVQNIGDITPIACGAIGK